VNLVKLADQVARRRTLLAQVGLGGLRVLLGLLMAGGHGWGKLMAWSQKADTFPDPLGVGSPVSLALAIFAELFCALLLAVGLGTRLVVVPLIVTMVVAAFVVHGGDPWQRKELAVLYLVGFLVLLVTGGGRFSLDAVVWPRVAWKAREKA
jgi:putative oxidoreductase